MIKTIMELGARHGDNVDIDDMLPDPTTLSRRVKNRADVEKEKIKDDIQAIVNSGQASITIDMWTDAYIKRNFMCATLHFCKNFNLCNIVLGMKSMNYENSTGENIKQKLLTLLREFGVHNLTRIKYVTDRGSNIKKALEFETRLNCSNHLLSNIIESAVDDGAEMKSLISSSRKLIKYFKKANLQHLLETSLKSYCPTRWNSYFNMFKSIVDNWSAISEILNSNLEEHRMSSIHLSELTPLVRIFADIDVISRKLQGTNYPTLCYVLPSIEKLKTLCAPNATDSEMMLKFKSKIIEETATKWENNLNILHKIAQFLYPPTNQRQQENMEELKTFCVYEMTNMELYGNGSITSTNNLTSPSVSLTLSSSPEDSSTVSTSTPLPAPDEDNQFFFPELVRAAEDIVAESPSDEVERYVRKIVPIAAGFDALKWWECNAESFPKLHKLAINILSIPASSAASERVFSMAGNIITEKRNRLAPKTVDSLIFLNSYLIYKSKQ